MLSINKFFNLLLIILALNAGPVWAGLNADEFTINGIVITDDLNKARKQANQNPKSFEALFNLATAYTRSLEIEKSYEYLKDTKSLLKKTHPDGQKSYVPTIDKFIGELSNKKFSNNSIALYRLAFLKYLKSYAMFQEEEEELITQREDLRKTIKANKQIVASLKAPVDSVQSNSSPKKADPKTTQQITEKEAEIAQLKTKRKSLKAELEELPDDKRFLTIKQSAASGLDKILADNPQDIWSLGYRGFISSEMADLNTAQKYWSKAKKLNPQHPLAYFLEGKALMDAGRAGEGLGAITQSMLLRAQAQSQQKAKNRLKYSKIQ